MRGPRSGGRGATTVEYAFMAPLALIVTVAFYDLAAIVFLALSLENAALTAARFGATNQSVEGLTRAEAIERIVDEATLGLLGEDGLTVEARVYPDNATLAAAEWLDDRDGDGAHDAGERFVDADGDGVWDGDPGAPGFGGANEVVLYTIVADYTLATPMLSDAIGPIRLHAATPVVNEPF